MHTTLEKLKLGVLHLEDASVGAWMHPVRKIDIVVMLERIFGPKADAPREYYLVLGASTSKVVLGVALGAS